MRTLRTGLEFVPSADRVPKLFCERMNRALASSGSQEGKILEHWGSLRSLRDYREANVPGAESEHPSWEGCQEHRPLHSVLPWRPAHAGFQTCVPSPYARLHPPGLGEWGQAGKGWRGRARARQETSLLTSPQLRFLPRPRLAWRTPCHILSPPHVTGY